MNTNKCRKLWLLAIATIAISAGCQTSGAARSTELIEAPPQSIITYSSYQPVDPYTPIANGLLGRPAYSAENTQDGYMVEVIDYLIGPGMSTAEINLDGDAVMEVRAGSGMAIIDGEEIELVIGTVFTVSIGNSMNFENNSETALQIRVHVVRE